MLKKIIITLILVVFTIISFLFYSNSFNSTTSHVKEYNGKLIVLGYWHCLELVEGNLYSWGENWYGQLGNGTTLEKERTINESILSNVKDFSCGAIHSIAVKNDGTVWVWGGNDKGQLGLGTKEKINFPTKINFFNNAVSVACGNSHTLVLLEDGSVYSMGYNCRGQLGNGNLEDKDSPVKVMGLENIKYVSCGKSNSVALSEDGFVWVWGGYSTQGDKILGVEKKPSKIKELNHIIRTSSGGSHNLALKDDGTVWAWGMNGNGQLGNGTTKEQTIPVQVKNLKNIIDIACGEDNSFALSKDGIVWAWGGNSSGQLGNKGKAARTVPIKVMEDNSITGICANYYTTILKYRNGDIKIMGFDIIQNKDKTLLTSLENKISDFEEATTSPNALYDRYHTDSDFSEQWGIKNTGQLINGKAGISNIDINILPVWNKVLTYYPVTVGILDTGIDINHDAIKNSIFTNNKEIPNNQIDDDKNGFIDDINGWDFINNDNSVFDSEIEDSHGTHVCGIISSGGKTSKISGVAPNIKALPLKFIIPRVNFYSDAISAVIYAKKFNVRIINASIGSVNYIYPIKEMMGDKDILFVCAAGNYGKNVDISPAYPACYNLKNVLTVAAVDNRGILSNVSNYGKSIDIAAPGVDIYSTLPDGKYGYMSGTSMAAPFATGVAAILLSKKNKLSPTDIIATIKNNSKKYKDIYNMVDSNGIIDAYSSIK